jgi:hypothetical protein
MDTVEDNELAIDDAVEVITAGDRSEALVRLAGE